MTQDIIGALSRFSNLRMMSWDAVSQYEAATPPLDQVTRDLGVRYVVRGSVRRDPDRMRVAVRLTDAVGGVLLWSRRYDKDLDDLFAVQEEITQGVVGALAVQLTAIEQERAFAKPTDNLDAYDYVLRGRQHFARETRSQNLKARALFEKAIDLAPDYAEAFVALGWTYNHDAAYGWAERPERSLQRGFDLAQEAIRHDPSSSSAHTILSNVHVHRQRHDLGLVEIDRAIDLNPSEAEAHGWRGFILLALGRTAESIDDSETALRFNPNSPPSVSGNLGWAYFLEGRYDDAVATLESSLGQHPDVLFGHLALAASYAASDRPDDAARAAANARRLHPFFEARPFSELFRDADHRVRIVQALQSAGLE
jgi:tetratricopeptide (TPR) repeat protein